MAQSLPKCVTITPMTGVVCAAWTPGTGSGTVGASWRGCEVVGLQGAHVCACVCVRPVLSGPCLSCVSFCDSAILHLCFSLLCVCDCILNVYMNMFV